MDEGDYFTHLILGVVYVEAGLLAQAVRSLERALALNPSDSRAHISLGMAKTLRGNAVEGIAHMERGFQLNPRDPQYHILMALMAHAQLAVRQYEEAESWARRAIESRGNYPEPHLVLAATLGHLDRPEEAMTEIETFERLVVGLGLGRITVAQFLKVSLPLTAVSLVLILPLNYFWWRLIGVLP